MAFRGAMTLIAAVAAPAVAAPAGDASDRVLAPLTLCRASTDRVARAACYDRAYDDLRARLASGDVVITDAAHRQAGFGLPTTIPKRSGAGKTNAPVPMAVDAIDTTIVATRPYGVDMFTFQLGDGGVWRTADAGPDPQFPRGSKVHLKRVLLGGILLQGEHGRAVKVIRLR